LPGPATFRSGAYHPVGGLSWGSRKPGWNFFQATKVPESPNEMNGGSERKNPVRRGPFLGFIFFGGGPPLKGLCNTPFSPARRENPCFVFLSHSQNTCVVGFCFGNLFPLPSVKRLFSKNPAGFVPHHTYREPAAPMAGRPSPNVKPRKLGNHWMAVGVGGSRLPGAGSGRAPGSSNPFLLLTPTLPTAPYQVSSLSQQPANLVVRTDGQVFVPSP